MLQLNFETTKQLLTQQQTALVTRDRLVLYILKLSNPRKHPAARYVRTAVWRTVV